MTRSSPRSRTGKPSRQGIPHASLRVERRTQSSSSEATKGIFCKFASSAIELAIHTLRADSLLAPADQVSAHDDGVVGYSSGSPRGLGGVRTTRDTAT
jgi:hypothetical protein